MTSNILLVGVGGQGTILASNLLTRGLLAAGYDVKMSEIHGMSQRGGSVSSMIRYGDSVSCPVIEAGAADLLIAFEKLEALRSLRYLKPSGKVIVNDERIDPMGVLSQTAAYPENVLERISIVAPLLVIPASKLAEELGNGRVMNVILLGAIVKSMGLESVDWKGLISQSVREAFVELNTRAFDVGYSYTA